MSAVLLSKSGTVKSVQFFHSKCVVGENTVMASPAMPLRDLCQVVSSFTQHCVCIVNFRSVGKANSILVLLGE